MKPAPIISPVLNGKLSPAASGILRNTLNALEGKTASIVIKQHRRKRSVPQNGFYWGVVIPMVCGLFAEYGNAADQETVHRFLKGQVGDMKTRVEAPDGTSLWQIETSTELTTQEWEDWLDKIRAWAAPFGLEIPYPNERAA